MKAKKVYLLLLFIFYFKKRSKYISLILIHQKVDEADVWAVLWLPKKGPGEQSKFCEKLFHYVLILPEKYHYMILGVL